MRRSQYDADVAITPEGKVLAVIHEQILAFSDMPAFKSFLDKLNHKTLELGSTYLGSSERVSDFPPIDETLANSIVEEAIMGMESGDLVTNGSFNDDERETIKAMVCAYLDTAGIDYEVKDEVNILSNVRGPHGLWGVYGRVMEELDRFLLAFVRRYKIPQARYPEVAEYLHRVNYGLVLGNFEIDLTDGEVRYKTSIDVEGGKLTSKMIEQMFEACAFAMNRYTPGLDMVTYGGYSALEALEQLETCSPEEENPVSKASISNVNKFLMNGGWQERVCFGNSGKLKVLNLPSDVSYNPFPDKPAGRFYLSYTGSRSPETDSECITQDNIGEMTVGMIIEGINWLRSKKQGT